MARLNNLQVDFLLANWRKFHNRAFIIDVMTVVGNRPMLEVYKSEMLTASMPLHTISPYETPKDAEYMKPYGLDMLPDYLKADPVHAWRAETGVELVHKEPTIYELIRVWRNWQLMSIDAKAMSDGKSMELFGVTNKQHFENLYQEYLEKELEHETGIVELTDVTHEQSCRASVSHIDGRIVYSYRGNGLTRLYGETDTFSLPKGELSCYNGDVPLETTVGRFLLNVLLVELPFKGKIAYINDTGFDLSGLEKQISEKLMNGEIEVKAYKEYVDNLYFIGHFTELCVPNYSRASLTTAPDMSKLKEELLKKYAGRLEDPEAIAEIEAALITADKAYLKDDVSMRFYKPLGGKPFNVARKKMYLTVGGIEAFSKDSGKYNFIPNSLAEGWDVNALPVYANEIRKGSYNRGHETQLGGAQTKYIVRVFQDLVLSEEDCGATKGLTVDFSIHDPKKFIGRFVRVNGKWVPITKDDLSKYAGKQYVMRSPMFCRAQHGLCKTCAGKVFSKLGSKHLSMYIVDISSTFTTMSLKLMHGSKLELIDLGDLDQYLV